MKSTIKATAMFVAILLICICAITGCSNGPEGRWELIAASMGGKEIDLENSNGITVLELTLDGTAIIYSGDLERSTGSWAYKDDTLYIDNSAVGYDGNTINMMIFGIEMIFQRI